MQGWRVVGEEPFSLAQKQEFEAQVKEAKRLAALNALFSVVVAAITTWATIWLAMDGKPGFAAGAAVVGFLVFFVFLLRMIMQYSYGGIIEGHSRSGVNLLYEPDNPAFMEAYEGDDPPFRILGTDGLVRVPKVER